MKHLIFLLSTLLVFNLSMAQEMKEIKLNTPNKERGSSVMKALQERASVREYADKALSIQDLSDLLWAANGINRPDGRRTAPTARNMQDIDVYVCLPEGTYLYDAKKNLLKPVAAGDLRPALATQQEFVKKAPVVLLLVSDIARFDIGISETAKLYGAMDAGYVSQNINIFCASVGMATVPRAYMDKEKIKEVLKLTETQIPMLNNPVGYKK